MDEKKNIDDSLEISVQGIERRRKILDLACTNGRRMLDVGAGPLGIIAAKEYGFSVTALDTSSEKIEQVRLQAAGENVSLVLEEGDGTRMGYADDSFDLVVVYGTLHHLPEEMRELMVREAFRVAKEKLIVAEFTKAGFEKIHPDWEYGTVDLGMIRSVLESLGSVECTDLGDMNVYVCLK